MEGGEEMIQEPFELGERKTRERSEHRASLSLPVYYQKLWGGRGSETIWTYSRLGRRPRSLSQRGKDEAGPKIEVKRSYLSTSIFRAIEKAESDRDQDCPGTKAFQPRTKRRGDQEEGDPEDGD